MIHIKSVPIYFVNFRLGEEFARIYEEFEVNTSKIKSISNVFKREHSPKIESIGHLCNHLFFVRKRLIKFGDIVGTLASNTFWESTYYSPSLLEMHQHECGDILYDIFMVAANPKHFFRCTDNFKDMNIGLRLVYTFSKFLNTVVQCNTKVCCLRHRSQSCYVWIGYKKKMS